MSRYRRSYNLTSTVLSSTVAVGASLALGLPPLLAGDQNGAKCATLAHQAETTPASVSQGSAGQRIYIDPETGERTSPPAASEPLFESSHSATTREAAQSATLETVVSDMTSDEGLEIEPSPVPGGGMKVNLQGRFRQPLVATIDPDGQVHIQHKDHPHSQAGGEQ